jgi:DNA-binding NtrC family response regulator
LRPMIHIPVGTSLADMERELVKRTLTYTGNNRQRTATLLGISRRALYNKIERFGLTNTSKNI